MAFAISLVATSLPAAAAAAAAPVADKATEQMLVDLLRIDTTNGPGDTRGVAAYLTRIFNAAGIENETIVAPNGMAAHFIARLHGNGSKRPVLLAAHADVVPADRTRWSVDAFAGTVKDGYVWGRGALDNKGAVAAFAAALLRLKANDVRLARDVIFLAEADEEQGQYNTSWLADVAWPKIDAEFVLNEGGVILAQRGHVRQITVTYGDKISLNVRLQTSGPSGHSSRPLPISETANGQLVTALQRLQRWQTPIALTPATRQYLTRLAAIGSRPLRRATMRLLAARTVAARAAALPALIAADPGGWGLEGALRATLVTTMINAGVKPNVIPGRAEAIINARLMPNTDVPTFLASVRAAIGNSRVTVSIAGTMKPEAATAFYAARAAAPSSPIETDLYRATERAAQQTWPGVAILPTIFVATTDAIAWRQRGIPVYGISPFAVDKADLLRIHGDDERLAQASIRDGADYVYRIVDGVAAAK